MKCPKCHRDMVKVTEGSDNWWHCNNCKTDVGKSEKPKEENK